MQDRQTWSQWQRLHVKVWSGLGAEASHFFLLVLLSSKLALRVLLKEEAAWWMVCYQALQSGASFLLCM